MNITSTVQNVLHKSETIGVRVGRIVMVSINGVAVEEHLFWYTYTPQGATLHHIETRACRDPDCEPAANYQD